MLFGPNIFGKVDVKIAPPNEVSRSCATCLIDRVVMSSAQKNNHAGAVLSTSCTAVQNSKLLFARQ